MQRTVAVTAGVLPVVLAAALLLYRAVGGAAAFILAVTCATTAYHFYIRLAVGAALNAVMKNWADSTRPWYRVSRREMTFYKRIGVKHWKDKMPTYRRENFDCRAHSWDEIAQTTCQSELAHEINILFSFLPLLASLRIGAFWAFFITSLLSAVFDLMLVFVQRYNRARILKMEQRRQATHPRG